ncbi:MAG: hypothetical protein E7363_00335 [Clostridiales bacterium]|nr:hypothetical protein [Clostridiales bacterium]
MDIKQLLESLRASDETLETLKLADVVIDKRRRSVHFSFLCEKTVSEALQERILHAVNEVVPDGFLGVTVGVEKRVADNDLVVHTVYNYLKTTQNAVSFELSKQDIAADTSTPVKRYVVSVSPTAKKLLEKSNAIASADALLNRTFCGTFQGSVVAEKPEENFVPLAENNTVNFRVAPVRVRSFYVNEVFPIDDKKMVQTALYMEDALMEMEGVVHAGVVLSVSEKETKNGKPYFVFEYTDRTAAKPLRAFYFSKKGTVEKVRKIKEGDAIITSGKYENGGSGLRYTIQKLNLCTFPPDFKPMAKEKRQPAPEYCLVHPTGFHSTRQKALFDVEENLPECLKGKTFVVFDLETTGTTPTADMITEIGAVRIVDGKITDLFSTFVNPERPIPTKIVELTGITDEMVADAPKFSEVVGDFYKYVEGAIMVAHNAPFDMSFMRFHGRNCEYMFDNVVMDTLDFSREVLPHLANHKLNTVCAHFGIEFQHHRACYDALATAEMFLELIKLQKRLPNAKK